MKRIKSFFSNPRYQGKHVLVVGNNVYAVKTAREASTLFDKLVKEKGVIPAVTFVPRAQALILLICR